MDLKFSPKHNICAYLDKTHPESAQYHQMIDFLVRSKIHYAITVNPPVYENLIRSFWATASYTTDNNVSIIRALVDNKDVVITEDTIRQVLRFADATENPTEFSQALIEATFNDMGYQGDFFQRQVKKTLLSYNWRYLVHICIHCLSTRKGGFDTVNTTVSSAVVALVLNRPYNFSGLIFQGMIANIRGVQRDKFLMYPRFLQQIFNVQLRNLTLSGKTFKLDNMKKTIFTYMKSIHSNSPFDGRVTELFGYIVEEAARAQPVAAQDEFKVLEKPIEQHVDENIEEQVAAEQIPERVDDEETNDDNNDDVDSEETTPDMHCTPLQVQYPNRKRKHDENPPSTSSLPVPVNIVQSDSSDENYISEPSLKKRTVRKNVHIVSSLQQKQPEQRDESEACMHLPTPTSAVPESSTAVGRPYDSDDDSMLPVPFISLRSQVKDLQQQMVVKDAEIATLKITVAQQNQDICFLKNKVFNHQETLVQLSKLVEAITESFVASRRDHDDPSSSVHLDVAQGGEKNEPKNTEKDGDRREETEGDIKESNDKGKQMAEEDDGDGSDDESDPELQKLFADIDKIKNIDDLNAIDDVDFVTKYTTAEGNLFGGINAIESSAEVVQSIADSLSIVQEQSSLVAAESCIPTVVIPDTTETAGFSEPTKELSPRSRNRLEREKITAGRFKKVDTDRIVTKLRKLQGVTVLDL